MNKTIAALLAGATIGVGGAALRPTDFGSLQEIQAAQEAYLHQTGAYFLSTDNKDPRAELGKSLPEGYQLYTYIRPDESRGWWIEYTDGDTLYSIGYGPDATERTYTKKIELWNASTTP